MFGRVRPSSCSPDSLERSPPKKSKDDSLSIYETTLMKLKLGSRHDINPPSEEAMQVEINSTTASVSTSPQDATSSPSEAAAMTIQANSSPTTSLSSSGSQSRDSSKEQLNGNVSLHYLFSRYQTSRHESAMMMENGGSSCSSSSPSSSNYQSM